MWDDLSCSSIVDTAHEKIVGDETVHSNVSSTSIGPFAMQRFRCSICLIPFPSEEERDEHLRQNNKHGYYTICHCGKPLKTKQGYDIHFKMQHGSMEGTVSCPVCRKKCFNESILKTHIITHEVVGAYKCDRCHKRFKRKHGLAGHKLVCPGKPPLENRK